MYFNAPPAKDLQCAFQPLGGSLPCQVPKPECPFSSWTCEGECGFSSGALKEFSQDNPSVSGSLEVASWWCPFQVVVHHFGGTSILHTSTFHWPLRVLYEQLLRALSDSVDFPFGYKHRVMFVIVRLVAISCECQENLWKANLKRLQARFSLVFFAELKGHLHDSATFGQTKHPPPG